MKYALEVSRSTGIEFLGPWVLSTLALATEDERSAIDALDQGEEILNTGCVGHNYIDFYRNAMDVAWRLKDWDLIDRYADSLESYINDEPLPWAVHYIKRGRALASHGRAPSKDSALELARIKEKSRGNGLMSGISVIEEALGS